MRFHKLRSGVLAVVASILTVAAGLAMGAEPLRMSVDTLPDNRLRLLWPNTGQTVLLEEAANLGPPVVWLPSDRAISLQDGVYTAIVELEGATRFFRLQEAGGGFTTFTSSPFNGEQAVATTREIILRFNQPLAENTVLSVEDFHADF